ncbi:MAG: GMC family oxidoreductase N-terminal domain-containing protein, partial [Candidatus Omnitrophota bacterium]
IEDYKKEISVSQSPDGVGPVSSLILEGARILNWDVKELPRFWKYTRNTAGQWQGARQSMTETFIPAFLRAQGRLLPGTRVKKICFQGRMARSALAETRDESGRPKRWRIRFQNLFICGGAVQTPLLLRRSGIIKNIGNTLSMHPAIRVAARFDEPVFDPDEGVPAVQVNEFKPRITLGGSYSGLPHVALWMSGRDAIDEELADSGKTALFYALIQAEGKGRVRPLPLSKTPFVTLALTAPDLTCFGEGLYRLGSLLFAAGAQKIYSPFKGSSDFESLRSMEPFKKGVPRTGVDITTIHLFSSCPMGEDRTRCAVNSYGQVHGYDNVYLNDASILPGPPGINPQGLIMALARRNVHHFLDARLA